MPSSSKGNGGGEGATRTLPILMPEVSFGAFPVELADGDVVPVIALQIETILTAATFTFERGHFIQFCGEGMNFANTVKAPPRGGLTVVERDKRLVVPGAEG